MNDSIMYMDIVAVNRTSDVHIARHSIAVPSELRY